MEIRKLNSNLNKECYRNELIENDRRIYNEIDSQFCKLTPEFQEEIIKKNLLFNSFDTMMSMVQSITTTIFEVVTFSISPKKVRIGNIIVKQNGRSYQKESKKVLILNNPENEILEGYKELETNELLYFAISEYTKINHN